MVWKTTEYSGWGRVRTATAELARPERASTLKSTLADTACPAIGNCRSYGDAPLNDGGRAIDMTRMNRILDFDAETGVVTVEAGVTITTLAKVFAPQGWLPAVMPGTGFATVGGCIAQDVHGKNHHKEGSFGQHVLSVTLLNGEKRTVATPDRNAGLFRATMGGIGQTGVISEAKLQLKPCPGDVMMVTEQRAENWDAHLALLDASQACYCVGWIDATATGANLGRGIVEEAELAAGLLPKAKPSKKVPMDAPGFALSGPIVRTFNNAYYKRVPTSGRSSVKRIDEFFFPLDKIHDWNRLYGKRGFYQFQNVVPLDQADALKKMLSEIAGAGLASPLAVLKRMGPGRAGHMSFPMEGYTLAVDFPARDAAPELIGMLEDMTVDAGGRLYLAKDALATGPAIKAMYPEHGDWVKAVNKADPDHAFETDMVRRLDLRTAGGAS
ncbi:FAD-binding oxidoreductase [Aliiroseovarius sp. S1123]|jgi:decaprenylphospho-beta-D-ribofuranose 2-oxidase|uniref:FAD-binding oxidoreductase n=1 Tax=unclassified Aliiroseovarius TaxID=2623558 RepID=UPI001FF6A55B|nr:FAD-binding oxidoreductase [Aliiroseovarius sp. S1123]MCK0169970.1 FAD-binding oxidoreductase [Aliiroseovarius sp. S1123]